MNLKKHWFSITIVSIILIIFLLISFVKTNEDTDKYEDYELKVENQHYLSKGVS
ncbi:hypothetical protein RCL10_10670 [Staphylococcus lloydii]|uniref:hypothetical protein n=1 Tax=Staphylococcus lloydii TaxID=2781774 RepID=UPI002927F4E7|nr:hypothetical protein [Staphylococcus lloydii]MDU9418959.1 hypothetical protein [Staphylococcus lloydii]